VGGGFGRRLPFVVAVGPRWLAQCPSHTAGEAPLKERPEPLRRDVRGPHKKLFLNLFCNGWNLLPHGSL
jgi:hypothetical protein